MNESTPDRRPPPRTGPAGPLSGLRVLDLSAYIAGPYGFTRAVAFGRTPGPDPFAAPTLGQHDDVLRPVQ